MKMTQVQDEGLFHRLNQGGCPVQPNHAYKVAPFGLAIEKIPGTSHSQIFDLRCGGTGYSIELGLQIIRIVSLLSWASRSRHRGEYRSFAGYPWKKSLGKHSTYHLDGNYYEGEYVRTISSLERRAACSPVKRWTGCCWPWIKRRFQESFRILRA